MLACGWVGLIDGGCGCWFGMMGWRTVGLALVVQRSCFNNGCRLAGWLAILFAGVRPRSSLKLPLPLVLQCWWEVTAWRPSLLSWRHSPTFWWPHQVGACGCPTAA